MDQYTESELIDGIFAADRTNYLVEKEWLKGKKLSKESIKNIPVTELDLARSIAELIGTHIIYVKSESHWYIWDGTEYRKTEGDWIAHKVIKHTATLYADLVEEASRHLLTLNRATPDADKSELEGLSQLQSLNNKLHTASALDAYTKLLKTELDTLPEGLLQDIPFLTCSYLSERVALPHLVQDHIPSVGIGQLYGQSSAGKTIATVDLALSICAGLPTWQGLPLKTTGPSHVLYVAAEGGQPFWDMVEAWKVKHSGADISRFLVWDAGIGQTLTIGTSLEVAPGLFGLEALKAKVKAAGIDPSLVVFDPQANILSGVDENSNVDMVAALKPIQDWATEGQFLALLIHHEGKKDSGSGRGASSQKAMMDLLIKLTKNADNTRTLAFEKVKGSKDPDRKLNYTIETMEFSGGSGSGGVAVPAGAKLSIKERAERLGILDISKVQHAIKAGAASSSGIEKATGIGRNKVSEYLKTLEAQGIIQNLGGETRPRWTLISPDYEEPAA
jgi:hypothetical protein